MNGSDTVSQVLNTSSDSEYPSNLLSSSRNCAQSSLVRLEARSEWDPCLGQQEAEEEATSAHRGLSTTTNGNSFFAMDIHFGVLFVSVAKAQPSTFLFTCQQKVASVCHQVPDQIISEKQ